MKKNIASYFKSARTCWTVISLSIFAFNGNSNKLNKLQRVCSNLVGSLLTLHWKTWNTFPVRIFPTTIIIIIIIIIILILSATVRLRLVAIITNAMDTMWNKTLTITTIITLITSFIAARISTPLKNFRFLKLVTAARNIAVLLYLALILFINLYVKKIRRKLYW